MCIHEKKWFSLGTSYSLCAALVVLWIPSLQAAPIIVTGPSTGQVLTLCYFQPVGNNQVPVKTTFYSTGISPKLTLWQAKELNQPCNATAPVASAEPIAFNLQSYEFTLIPNATSPKSVEIELLGENMSEPFRSSVFMPNL